MTTPVHGTPDAPHLTVRGEATHEADPELARIHLTLTARGRDRRTTLDDLTHRNTTTLDLVKSYGDAVTHLSTGAFSITPEPAPRGRGERVRAYRGTVLLTAELTDFTALGELVTRLADLDHTRVDGPLWHLRPDSPAHRHARRQAVHEALRRAREYADALDTTLAALLELTDTGSAAASRAISHPDRLPGAKARLDTAPEPLDLEPRRIHLQAQVTATFTLTPPRL